MRITDTLYIRMKSIFTEPELHRIEAVDREGLELVVDLHGMKCRQARRFLENIIVVVGGVFKLKIIHGYNHGTALRDMLASNFQNTHVTNRYIDPYNEGVTYMMIA